MTTEKMTFLAWLPEITLPPDYRRKADEAMGVARNGLIQLMSAFGDPEAALRRNHLDHAAVRWARTQLRRLTDIVRYTLALFAIYLDPAPSKARAAKHRPHAARRPETLDAKTWHVRVAFLHPVREARAATGLPPPPHFAQTRDDPLRTLARRMEALRRVLADPMTHARRLARAIRTCTVVTRFPTSRIAARDDRDDYLADRRDMLHTTAWALDMFYRPNRYRDDTS